MKNYLRILAASTCLLFGLSVAASAHQTGDTSSDTSSTKHKHKSNSTATSADAATAPVAKSTRKPSTPANNASDADIAAAKSSGKVWVNTESKVYHKSGQFYGKTKHGQFMTEQDAQKAGYHEAKGEIGSKKS